MVQHIPARHRCRGFTLVEVLVVVAIIGVLISILIPTVLKVVEASKRTTCAANLRAISAGMVAYAIASDGWYPPPCPGTADGAYNYNNASGGSTCYTDRAYPNWRTGIGWLIARPASRSLRSGTTDRSAYVDNWRVFYCPTAERRNIIATAGWWTNEDNVDSAGLHSVKSTPAYTAFPSNYAQWNAWSPEYRDYTAKRMTDPSNRVLTGDKLGWIRSSNRFGLDYRPTNDLIQNHRSGGNFLFNDGRVEYRLIASPTDKSGFRVTGASNGNTAHWYALPDVKSGF